MNKPLDYASEIVDSAINQFTQSTGIDAKWIAPSPVSADDGFDGDIEFSFPSSAAKYHVIVKRKIDRQIALNTFLRPEFDRKSCLLITDRLTKEMASRCHVLGVQFMDTAGNAFIHSKKGVFVFITGRQAPESNIFSPQKSDDQTTPAALRTTFAIMAQPDLLNATIREIAAVAGLSVGTVAQTINGLRGRGFVGTDGSGRNVLRDRGRLVTEWSNGYVNRLRPKLPTRRFQFIEVPGMYERGWLPDGAAWGGEAGAAILTNHLKPGNFTIYAHPVSQIVMSQLTIKLRLRHDPNGPLEIVAPFWNSERLKIRDVVPPELVFADLVMTADPRNIEIANIIQNTLIKDA